MNFYYREYTGGISGLGIARSQLDKLSRQVSHWKILNETGRDVIILGDSNLCSFQWEKESFSQRKLANRVQDFLLEEASQQFVSSIIRSELSGGVVHNSCIDHCYSDVREKITGINICLFYNFIEMFYDFI